MIADAIANALLIVVVFAACLHIVYAVLRLAIVALGATRTDPALRRIMRDRRGRGAAGGAVPPFLRAYRYRCDCPEGGHDTPDECIDCYLLRKPQGAVEHTSTGA